MFEVYKEFIFQSNPHSITTSNRQVAKVNKHNNQYINESNSIQTTSILVECSRHIFHGSQSMEASQFMCHEKYNDHEHDKLLNVSIFNLASSSSLLSSCSTCDEANKNQKDSDESCPRYLVAEITEHGTGLGHRFGVIAFTISLATEFGFTFVISDKIWNTDSMHDSYVNMKEELGLQHILHLSDIKNIEGFQIYNLYSREEFLQKYFSDFKHKCNLLVTMFLGGSNSCKNKHKQDSFCFTAWPGAFQRARNFLQNNNNNNNDNNNNTLGSLRRIIPNTLQHLLVVAWHIRCGDITLHMDNRLFFENIGVLFSDTEKKYGVEHKHIFLGKQCNTQFEFLKQIFSTALFMMDTDLVSTLRYFREADILIHTGSSFTVAVATSGPKNTQLFFQSMPKEKELSVETYKLHSAIYIDKDGLLNDNYHGGSKEEWREFVSQMLLVLFQRKMKTFSNISSSTSSLAAAFHLDTIMYYHIIAASVYTPSDVDIWSTNALLLQNHLPWWILRLYYNSSVLAQSICILRARINIELVDVSSSIPSSLLLWHHATTRLMQSMVIIWIDESVTLTACELEIIHSWHGGDWDAFVVQQRGGVRKQICWRGLT